MNYNTTTVYNFQLWCSFNFGLISSLRWTTAYVYGRANRAICLQPKTVAQLKCLSFFCTLISSKFMINIFLPLNKIWWPLLSILTCVFCYIVPWFSLLLNSRRLVDQRVKQVELNCGFTILINGQQESIWQSHFQTQLKPFHNSISPLTSRYK